VINRPVRWVVDTGSPFQSKLVMSQDGKLWTSLIQTKMSNPNVDVEEGSAIHLIIGGGKVCSFLERNDCILLWVSLPLEA
jgi:hypothetical protein